MTRTSVLVTYASLEEGGMRRQTSEKNDRGDAR